MKYWKELMEEALKELPALCPEWTDYNIHDPGITILELMAWLCEAQFYHMEQISQEHWKKYLKLLGITCKMRLPGHTLVTVNTGDGLWLAQGTRFFADDIMFESTVSQMVVDGIFLAFITKNSIGEYRLDGEWLKAGKGLDLYPFGKKPEKGAMFTLFLSQPLKVGKKYRLSIEAYHGYPIVRKTVDETLFDGHNFYPLAEMRMEYLAEDSWREIWMEEDQTYCFCQDGWIYFELDKPMSHEYQIRFVLTRSEYIMAPHITRISFAMVSVCQQESLPGFSEFKANGFPHQEFKIEELDMCVEKAEVYVESQMQKGAAELWERVLDFDNSLPRSQHYIIENGYLKFGDGISGMAPNGIIRLENKILTLGDKGNIKAGAIQRIILSPHSSTINVTNERAVVGGRKDETPREALERWNQEKGNLQRAVTPEDYEDLVKNIPGLMIKACHAYTLSKDRPEVMIAVQPYAENGTGVLNPAYKRNIYRYLEEKRLIGTRVKLVSPEYFSLSITCEIVAKVEYRNAANLVEEAVRNWIGQKQFGEGIIYSRLFGLIDTMACVNFVKSLWLETGYKGKRNERGDLETPPNGIVCLKNVTCILLEGQKGH